jgi:5-methyltetrahydropteroyltriglutamate--homocysteine methyltransferase
MNIPTEPIGSIPRPPRLLEAAEYVPSDRLGTCDDCGFGPPCDDTTTTRETAFAKIRARVVGTAMAAEVIGGS